MTKKYLQRSIRQTGFIFRIDGLPISRICTSCRKRKLIHLFSLHQKGAFGYRASCKKCEAENQRFRRHGDREYITPESVRIQRQRESFIKNNPAGANTYRKLFGRHEHRVVAEKILKRSLRRGEVVHHINENKHDNCPSNLEVITQSEHINKHRNKMQAARKEKCGY